jgi:DNA cross-link repair 1A protein
VIRGTCFVVDGFLRSTRKQFPKENFSPVFFLSHFHSDHYQGINSGWKESPIYCSEITANLVERRLKVDRKMLRVLPLETPTIVKDPLSGNVRVTLIDANHCPGAVLFLFELAGGTKVLHVGDFRYHPKMKQAPALKDLQARDLKYLYLDTTFNDPKFCYPPQDVIVAQTIELARNIFAEFKNPLVFFGTYSIGKENLFVQVAKALGKKIYASADRLEALRLCQYDMSQFVTDRSKASIHVVGMGRTGFQSLSKMMELDIAEKHDCYCGFAPTGWNWPKVTLKKRAAGDFFTLRQYERVYAYGVPYSEHSSYDELIECCKWLRPKKIIPTVHNTGLSKEAIFNQLVPFNKYIDETDNKRTIVGLFSKQKSDPGPVSTKQEDKKPIDKQGSTPTPSAAQRTIAFFFGGGGAK